MAPPFKNLQLGRKIQGGFRSRNTCTRRPRQGQGIPLLLVAVPSTSSESLWRRNLLWRHCPHGTALLRQRLQGHESDVGYKEGRSVNRQLDQPEGSGQGTAQAPTRIYRGLDPSSSCRRGEGFARSPSARSQKAFDHIG